MNRHSVYFLFFQVIWALLIFPFFSLISLPIIKFVVLVIYISGVFVIFHSRRKWPFDWARYISDHPEGKSPQPPGMPGIAWVVVKILEQSVPSPTIDITMFSSSGRARDPNLNAHYHAILINDPQFSLRDHLAFLAYLKTVQEKPVAN